MNSSGRPIPIPEFFAEAQCLSTKKIRRLLHPRFNEQPPPKPLARSATYTRRILRKRFGNLYFGDDKAHAVSFRESTDNSLILNKHYDATRSDLYFDQCFSVISVLGVGSFGKVFKVQSKEDGKFYAVKISKECFIGEQDRLERLEEVKKHEQLPKHPNCVKFIKAWEERQILYIQTELCEISLNTFAEQNDNIPEKLVWRYLVDLLQAVKHIHDHNLIHLDIKPANIFVSSHGVCKLGDFGLVVDLTKLSSTEPMEGDPKYMAAELMEGKFTKSADIFSLGITMLELSCDLDLPRNGDDWHRLRSGTLPSQFTNHLSTDLKRIISAMMEPDHTTRPSAALLLNEPVVHQIAKWRNSELNFISWISCLHYFINGWNSLICFITIFISWILSFSMSSLSSTPVVKRDHYNFKLPKLSVSDDENEPDSMIRGNLENSFPLPVLNLSDAADDSVSESGHSRAFMKMLSDDRLVNSTPIRKRNFFHETNSPSQFKETNRSCSPSISRISHHNGSLDDSFRFHLEPRNLRERTLSDYRVGIL
ncbi:Protein kinase, membrane associated tyrosine threonine 1 [Chamberlinius hualienensis]